MKKTVLVLMLALCLCLAGCSSDSKSVETTKPAQQSAVTQVPAATATPKPSEPVTEGDYTYRVKYDGTAIISKYEGSAQQLTIPSELGGHAVTEIAEQAFASCRSLVSVTIPEGVTAIGSSAFKGIFSIESITIPASVSYIGSNPFVDCTSLTSITIAEGNTALSLAGGALISNEDARLICYPESDRNTAEYTVPEGIRTIGSYAFYSSALKHITLPSTLTQISGNAFSYCSYLEELVIPEGVTELTKYAVTYCKKLTSVSIPASLTVIRGYALNSCESLTEITVPEGVTVIEDYAFAGCTALEKVHLPASLTEIASNAFMLKYVSTGSAGDPIKAVFSAPEGSKAQKFCMDNGLELS